MALGLPVGPGWVLLAVAVAMAAALWRLPVDFANPEYQSYSDASTAAGQGLVKHLGIAQDAQYNFITGWLARPPGAQYHIAMPSKKAVGEVPVIKLKPICKAICTKSKFPTVVSSGCAACLVLLSVPSWAHDVGGQKVPGIKSHKIGWQGNPPLARLPVYESGFKALASIPLLYPRRWATADLLQVWKCLSSKQHSCVQVVLSYAADACFCSVPDATS